jgi:hypothetical protein
VQGVSGVKEGRGFARVVTKKGHIDMMLIHEDLYILHLLYYKDYGRQSRVD